MVALNDFSQMNANVMRAVRSNAMDLRSIGSARTEMANGADTILRIAPDGLQATAQNSQAVLNAATVPSVTPELAPQMAQKSELASRMSKLGINMGGPSFN